AVPAPGLYLIDTDAEAHGAQTPALAAYVERWAATVRACAAAGAGTRQGTLTTS
ncbi:hypothetical protein CLV37_1161, partial [Kineococcus rhizosphaerae]